MFRFLSRRLYLWPTYYTLEIRGYIQNNPSKSYDFKQQILQYKKSSLDDLATSCLQTCMRDKEVRRVQ
jgi:hypothetical protein